MSKSRRLRLHEVRAAFRLVGECLDLGADSNEWRRHAFAGLCRLTGARVAIGGEFHWDRPDHPIMPILAAEVGMTPDEHDRIFVRFFRENGPNADVVADRLLHIPGRQITRTRKQLLPDRVWYGSKSYAEFRRPLDIDHCLISLFEVAATGTFDVFSLHRPAGERDYSARERGLARLAQAEAGRLVGGPLVSAADPADAARLPPRLRQTLGRLLAGDGEKQVAARLGVTRATVHQYVTALYRHFRVSSRAELLARVLRRGRRDGDVP